MQVRNTQSRNSELRIQELQAAHKQELAEVDRRWRQCLEQQLAEAETRHKEELAELRKEWHWERKVVLFICLCSKISSVICSSECIGYIAV